jgi:ubiquinone biosynthesis protein
MLNARLIPIPLVGSRQPVTIIDVPRVARMPALIFVLRLLSWAAVIVWLRIRRRGDPAEYGRRFRRLLEDLGGLWIKMGQLLSLRADLFPLEFCRELSRLQGSATGFPPSEAIRIIEADLGPIESVFTDFEEAPVAAASIGQVHLAKLRASGVRVAVKVQRPHLLQTFEDQLRAIRWIVWLLRLAHFRPHMRWDDLIWELEQIMREELDCRYEASATRRMRRTLRAHGIYAPKVFHASRRVLVTEFIGGVLMSEYLDVLRRDPESLTVWLAKNAIDPARVGRRLAMSLLRQLLEDNLYHGDLHPGNIMLLRDSRIALIDFGACSFIEREYQTRFRLSIYSLAVRDYARAADLALILSGTMPRVDIEPIRGEFVHAIGEWGAGTAVRDRPYQEKSMASLYNRLLRILYDRHCTMEWALLRIRRAQETLDASLMYLIPDVDYSKMASDYFRAASERARTADGSAALAAVANASHSFEFQQRLEEYTFFQAGIIRRHVRVFCATANDAVELLAATIGQLTVLSTAGAVLAVAVAIAQHRGHSWPIAGLVRPLDMQVWFVVIATGIGACISLARLRRRLRRPDLRTSERVAAL